ncbi:MAG: alpha/beta hydrolase [Phycisphaerales bacterium]|nr:alpha/beta hydrolase [Phycisphaerales bacterium]
MHETTSWTITNAHGLDILGNTHTPTNAPRACVLLLHGFKGYKDYGFIPVLAAMLAEGGAMVHRFNFSTSGMTNDLDTFARPDLFALDTWTRQVDDVRCVRNAINTGTLGGKGMPTHLVGHSRGGATAILAAGRHADELDLAGVVTINAVDECCRVSDEHRQAMLDRGYTISASARTKQELRINSTWLSEQLDDPDSHDVLGLCSAIGVPMLVLHGEKDDAVSIESGHHIAQVAQKKLCIIAGSNHVLNTANPAVLDAEASGQLKFVLANIQEFLLHTPH